MEERLTRAWKALLCRMAACARRGQGSGRRQGAHRDTDQAQIRARAPAAARSPADRIQAGNEGWREERVSRRERGMRLEATRVHLPRPGPFHAGGSPPSATPPLQPMRGLLKAQPCVVRKERRLRPWAGRLTQARQRRSPSERLSLRTRPLLRRARAPGSPPIQCHKLLHHTPSLSFFLTLNLERGHALFRRVGNADGLAGSRLFPRSVDEHFQRAVGRIDLVVEGHGVGSVMKNACGKRERKRRSDKKEATRRDPRSPSLSPTSFPLPSPSVQPRLPSVHILSIARSLILTLTLPPPHKPNDSPPPPRPPPSKPAPPLHHPRAQPAPRAPRPAGRCRRPCPAGRRR